MTGKRRAAGPAPKATSTKRSSAKRYRTRKQKVWRVAKWFLIAGLVGMLVLVGGFVYLYKTIDIPDPNKDFQTQTSFVYYADGKDEVGTFATQNRESIPLKQVPQTMQDAVVAAENRTFWTDKGIDPKGILRAAFSNATGNSTQGASTITQQYVKILYLTQERSYQRKIKEAILSLKIQRTQSKSEILEGYLNTIYFGRGAYGVEAAAHAFFDKKAERLNLRESAVLASVLNNPTHFDPANGKSSRRALKERYDYVLDGMAEADNITDQQATRAKKRLPKFPKIQAEDKYGGQRGHMLTLVRDELHQLGYTDEEIDGGGLRVTTTFTRKAMQAAEEGVMEGKPDGFGDKQLHVGVASVEPGTGALRGFYAGQDYLDSQINWAVAGGMVGSTIKPLTVATALENGYSLKDTFQGDSPFTFPDGLEVRNEGPGDGNDYGPGVTLTYATEQSINTAFVDLSNSMGDGPEKILETVNQAGIPPTKATKEYPGIPSTSRDLEADSLITLGKARISPINMANAYATVANGGERADVHVISKVVLANGKTDYQYKPHTTAAFDAKDEDRNADIAADTSYAMQQVVAAGTGQNAQALGRHAAGKTGTATNDDGDVSSSWFVGYTPQLATAVMYVRGDGDDALNDWLPSYFGADYPTQTWAAVMRRALEGEPDEEFPPPANLDGEAPQSGHDPLPTQAPTTAKPTQKPTQKPTKTPTQEPTKTPTQEPTQTPTQEPTKTPTDEPTKTPSEPSSPPTTGTSSPSASVSTGAASPGARERRGRRVRQG